tara:strand:+ start:457 stop:1239 length:783 start_codon:yes stop_codon:yes gene_type:complete
MRSHHLRAAGGGSGASIIQDGLEIHLDANNSNSYSGSGTTWTNLATSSTYGNAVLQTINNLSVYTSSNSATVPAYFTDLRAYINFSSRNVLVPFTYSVWIYITSFNTYMVLIEQATFSYSFEVHKTTESGVTIPRIGMWSPQVSLSRYDEWTAASSGNLVPTATLNTWYMVTMTYKNISNTNTRKIYINDTILATRSRTPSTDTGGTHTSWSFGSDSLSNSSYGSYPFAGRIGAYMVYDRVLSATEIASNYNATKSQYGL